MKKFIIAACLFAAGNLFLTSCNKKLKDDIKDLEKQVQDLQSKSNEIDSLKIMLGANEPIVAVTTYKDYNDSSITVRGNYKFKANDTYTSKMVKQSDGTYYIYVERFSDVEWYEGAWAGFYYDPTNGSVSDIEGGQYWYDANGDKSSRYRYYYNPAPTTLNIDVHSINLNTGDIHFTFTGAYDATVTNHSYGPVYGKPTSTTFSFRGKLGKFEGNKMVATLLKTSGK